MSAAVLVALVLMCAALILIGAVLQKPHGFVVVTLALLALLLVAVKGFPSL